MCECIIVLFLWIMLGLMMIIATIAVLLNKRLCQKIELLQKSLTTYKDVDCSFSLQKRRELNISQKLKMTRWQWLKGYISRIEAHTNQYKGQLKRLLQWRGI